MAQKLGISGFLKMSNSRTAQEKLLKQRIDGLVPAVGMILLIILAMMFLSSLFGCATTVAPTVLKKLEQPAPAPSHLVAEVKLGNATNSDCTSQTDFVEKITHELLQLRGVPTPTTMDVEMRPGSSLCGDARGVNNSVTMLQQGAFRIGIARIVMWWDNISLTELKSARELFDMMAPKIQVHPTTH